MQVRDKLISDMKFYVDSTTDFEVFDGRNGKS
jgi:hypothetical protein